MATAPRNHTALHEDCQQADKAGAAVIEARNHSRHAASLETECGGEEDRDPEPERYFPNPDRPQVRRPS